MGARLVYLLSFSLLLLWISCQAAVPDRVANVSLTVEQLSSNSTSPKILPSKGEREEVLEIPDIPEEPDEPDNPSGVYPYGVIYGSNQGNGVEGFQSQPVLLLIAWGILNMLL